MKIQFLGTAAYDAMPAPFCTCETCARARKAGGKNYRTRSQALIDDELLLDFNPDTVAHLFQYGVDWDKIDHCLITHSHSDHLYVKDICIPQYSSSWHKVNYYAGQAGYDILVHGFTEYAPVMARDERASAILITPYQEFQAGNYRVLPLKADHDPKSSPVIYAIERDGKKLLYGHDSGLYGEETMQALKAFGRLDLVSFDCTGGLNGFWGHHHLSFASVLEQKERLQALGVIDEKTIIVINHFSHNGLATYEDLVAEAEKYAIIVSYDGLTLEF